MMQHQHGGGGHAGGSYPSTRLNSALVHRKHWENVLLKLGFSRNGPPVQHTSNASLVEILQLIAECRFPFNVIEKEVRKLAYVANAHPTTNIRTPHHIRHTHTIHTKHTIHVGTNQNTLHTHGRKYITISFFFFVLYLRLVFQECAWVICTIASEFNKVFQAFSNNITTNDASSSTSRNLANPRNDDRDRTHVNSSNISEEGDEEVLLGSNSVHSSNDLWRLYFRSVSAILHLLLTQQQQHQQFSSVHQQQQQQQQQPMSTTRSSNVNNHQHTKQQQVCILFFCYTITRTYPPHTPHTLDKGGKFQLPGAHV